ncbi:MAG: DUF2225 domain-containing protein [Candidatus Coatesbacteria bacterium]|nr:DUF2225 domain-containing protein [Candidatus Coatesbacteria bacterium]
MPSNLYLCLLLLAGLPTQAPATEFAEREVECPVCGESSVYRLPLEVDSNGGVSTDLAVYSSNGVQPWRYWIAYSPECGYTDWVGRFADQLRPEEVEFIEESFGAAEFEGIRRGELPLWERYRNLYLLEEYRGAPAVELADILLCGWWCLRPENVERETRLAYLGEITELLGAALIRGEVGDDQLAERVYLIGELERQAGDVVDARRRLSEARTMPGVVDSDITGFIERAQLLNDSRPLRRRVLEGTDAVVSHPDDAAIYDLAVDCWTFLEGNPSQVVDRGDAALAAWFYGERLGRPSAELAEWRARFETAYALELETRPLIYAADELGILERLAAGECACDD